MARFLFTMTTMTRSGFFKLCAGVWRRVCDDDRDLDGEPEEARLAGSFPNPGGEGRLLQGR